MGRNRVNLHHIDHDGEMGINGVENSFVCPLDDVEKVLVSVILTARNERDDVEDCITSILEQSYQNFELIFIDAKSTDGTFEKASKLEAYSNSFKNCKRFLFVSVEADSAAKGRNLGVNLARGTIIAFIDADCVAEKNWLLNLVNYIPKERGVIGGPSVLKHSRRTRTLDAIDSVLGTYLGSGGSPQFLKIERLCNVYAVPACNMAIHKKLFTEMGGFDEKRNYNEDSSLCDMVQRKGYQIIYNPNAVVYHFMGLDSFSSFSGFLYKYGKERGKNAADEARLFSKFNIISISLICLLILFAALSFVAYTMFISLVALLSIFMIVIGYASLNIAIRNGSPVLGALAMSIYISIFILYNAGLLYGYLGQKMHLIKTRSGKLD